MSEETEISRPNSSFSSHSSTLPPAQRNPLEKSLVIGIPGSMVFRKHAFQLSWLTSLAKEVEDLREAGYAVALVVGESPDVRAAAHAGRQLGLAHSEMESATRSSSQLHAALVLRTLAQAHPHVCDSIQDTVSLLQQGMVPVMLGSRDTLSTEARAAMLAEAVSAKFVLFTDMDVPANTITHARFSRMAGEAAFRSNQEFVVDALTALILARAKIETFLVGSTNVGKLSEMMESGANIGTRITASAQMQVRSIARGELPREQSFESVQVEREMLVREQPQEEREVRAPREVREVPQREEREPYVGPEPVLKTYMSNIPKEDKGDPDENPTPGHIARHLG